VASRAPCPSLERERLAWNAGRLLIGVDEAGRGPLAGPVVAAAVVFPADGPRLRKIRDSKVLTEIARDRAALRIRLAAIAVGVGAASVREIDRFNIRIATIMAMRRAVARARAIAALGGGSGATLTTVLVDGLALPELGIEHEALVDGDARCLSVAAAGIIAKTVRDRLMTALARRYPGYDWSTNRGYGTEAHRRAIDEHGPTPHHRRSFTPVAQMHLGL
jgi:ribonuclease HII